MLEVLQTQADFNSNESSKRIYLVIIAGIKEEEKRKEKVSNKRYIWELFNEN